MLQHRLFAAVLFASASLSVSVWAAAPKNMVKVDPGLSAVEKVLRAEVAGPVDRRTQLNSALESHPDSPAARWQAGFVRDGKGWQSFDAAILSGANSASRRDYVLLRERAEKTLQGQLDLANWCRKAELFDQEQAHLTAALALASPRERPSLLQRLGWQQVGTQWLSHEQILEWQHLNHLAEASLKKWSSKLERIAERLTAGKRSREAALAELDTVTDRSAVPAIELVLAGRDEACAEAAIEALQRIEGPESSLALARQAVFSGWPDVRKSAAARLKSRNLEDFVPGLISLLSIPARREHHIAYDQSGIPLLQSYILAVETEDQFRVQAFQVVNQNIDVVVGRIQGWNPGRLPARFAVGPPMQRRDDARMLADRLFAADRQQDAVDDRIVALNEQVSQALAIVSGIDGSADPRRWWQWWSGHTDLQAADKKSVTIVDEQYASLATYTPVMMRTSCFAAGTPVWTGGGREPIENVRMGDRVLAKDVETGELAYKVVLQTTVRPPKELTTLRFSEETIVCTGGHRFWNSGTGWIKARDLSPQTLLHTVTGNTLVWSAKKGDTAETYNLVVADFHTYFVGNAGVLCQDLLIPRGTNSVVPGLQRKSK